MQTALTHPAIEYLSSKLAPIAFPAQLHLSHKLNEALVLPDPGQKNIAHKQPVAGDTLFDRHLQPLHCLFTVPAQRIDASDIVGEVMMGFAFCAFSTIEGTAA